MWSGLLRARPFGKDNELDQSVRSDHAQIGCRVSDDDGGHITIHAYNISNPRQHGRMTGTRFGHTHMNSGSHRMPKGWRAEKIEHQLDEIERQLMSNQVDIFILTEAYWDFTRQLSNRLDDTHVIVSPMDCDDYQHFVGHRNMTVIVCRRSLCSISDTKNGRGHVWGIERDSSLRVPWLRLNNGLLVVAVHASNVGSDAVTDRPHWALFYLGNTIAELLTRFNTDRCIALGDFNTSTQIVRQALCSSEELRAIEPLYPTYMNVTTEVCAYDNIVATSALGVTALGVEEMPPDTLAYVQCLKRSVVN